MTAQVNIVGNATRDPELIFSTQGTAVAKFGVAVNRREKKNGEWVDGTPSFFNVVCFNDMAENVAASITKGTRVVVIGRLQQDNWENNEGEKRTSIEVIADEIAPSLRWARAEIERVERDRPSSNSGGDTPAYPSDEEPF